jgi:hypothetical protein
MSWLRNIVVMAGGQRRHNAFVWVPYGTIDESPGEADWYLLVPVVFVPVWIFAGQLRPSLRGES